MHIVIVEDEPVVAQRIERLTRDILKNKLSTIKCFNAVDAALDYLSEKPIDLLLLDLNLNGRNGFDVLSAAVAESFQTVIISAFSEQAITAFDYGVVDFVNKPFSKARLEKAIGRCMKEDESTNAKTKYLAIKKHHSLELIHIDDICFIQACNIYSEVVMNDGKIHLHDKALGKLAIVLPSVFKRIHKSYVVKMSEVKRVIVHKGSKYEVELSNERALPIGRTYYKSLMEYFN
jgi:DNA-binding LytR/AlgR family response regulator